MSSHKNGFSEGLSRFGFLTLMFLVLLSFNYLPVFGGQQEGRRVALLVGNDAYIHKPLKNAVNDARSMKSVLQGLDFSVQMVEDVSLRDLERAVDSFTASLRAGDVGLFFYSGHGLQIGGENYLVPVNFDAQDEVDAKYDCYSAERLREKMEGSGARLNIIILDACRDNPFSTSRSGSRGLAAMNATRGTFIAFATGPNKTASDNPRGENGLYSSYLLQALKVPGLSLDQVFNKVRADVDRASNHRQTPWSVSSVIGEFYFSGEAMTSSEVTYTEPSLNTEQMYQRGKSSLDAKNYSEALKWLYPAAEDGHAGAQRALGSMYINGRGVDRDYAEGLKWTRKSAEQGHPRALRNMAIIYWNGFGVPKNETEAFRYMKRASDRGDAPGKYFLALMYEQGVGVAKNENVAKMLYGESVEPLWDAAEDGDHESYYYLGTLYGSGLGVERDYSRAYSCFLWAAEKGSLNGQYSLGVCYENGHGVAKDVEKAVSWYRAAAVQGHERAKRALQRLGR